MFEVGDKVVCQFGAGEVVMIDPDAQLSVTVLVDDTKVRFTRDGRFFGGDTYPTLFHGTEWPVVAEPDRRVWRMATLQDIADAVMGETFEVRNESFPFGSGVITSISLRPPVSVTFGTPVCRSYLSNLEVLR